MHKLFFLVLSSFLLFTAQAYSQAAIKMEKLNLYSNPNVVINGTKWFDYGIRYKGHQYLDQNKFTKGRIWFEDRVFDNILLNYDLEKDMLVVCEKDIHNKFIYYYLNNSKVKAFTIQNANSPLEAHFIKYPSTPTSTKSFFYQLLQDGEIKLLLRHKKYVLKETSEMILGKYVRNEKIYLAHNNQLFRLRNRRSILNLFPDKKKQLKKYMRQNRLYPSKRNLTAFKSVVNYCNQQNFTLLNNTN